MSKKRLSVVVPIYNEERVVGKFLDEELSPILKQIEKNYSVEVILVDDGSSDKSLDIIRKTTLGQTEDAERLKIISFSRNFGKEIALSAGIKYATGDAIVMIDADGQHPVNAITEMLVKWEDGAKIVTAVRERSMTKHKLGSKIFYQLMRLMGTKTINEGELDFRLIDREVANEFNRFTEHNRIARGLIDWLGFSQEYIVVKLNNRKDGAKGTYSFRKLVALAGDCFVSMSRTPLLIFGGIGVLIAGFSLILGLFILIEQYILGDPLGLDWSGAVAMSVFVAFLVGLVLISQSITAIYISQIHNEAKNRPLFVIDREKSQGISNDEK